MTKKKILSISFLATIISFILSPSNLYTYCFQEGNCVRLWDTAMLIGPYLFIVPVIFLFSLITYFLREEVFRTWLGFAYWWVPFSVVTIFVASKNGGGGWGIPNIFDQETVSLILSGLFAFASLTIIVWKHLSVRRTGFN